MEPSERHDAARALGAALRGQRMARGLSLRALARAIGLSAHATLVDYEYGRRIPPEDLVSAYERVLGVPDALLHRMRSAALTERADHQTSVLLDGRGLAVTGPATAAGAPQPVADGSDPERAACHLDATTAHARKLAMTEYRLIGQIELRYSASCHAAWGRFVGVPALDHIAGQRSIDILVEAVREPDGASTSFRHEYCFDVHWCDLLVSGGGRIHARAVVYAGDAPLAAAETDRIWLP
jgi:transcriptional regulator with XRE-family HTH domain